MGKQKTIRSTVILVGIIAWIVIIILALNSGLTGCPSESVFSQGGVVYFCDTAEGRSVYFMIALTNGIMYGAAVGGVLIVIGAVIRHSPRPAVPAPSPAQTMGNQPTIKETVIREIVKVKCPFCGTLVDHLASTCPHCAGVLR